MILHARSLASHRGVVPLRETSACGHFVTCDELSDDEDVTCEDCQRALAVWSIRRLGGEEIYDPPGLTFKVPEP